jgi:sulfofructose kinase
MSHEPAAAAPHLVVCLGSLVADHVFRVAEVPQPPSKDVARAYRMGPGGMAATAAVAVARLGGRAALWGRVGDDLNGGPLAGALAAEGVDVSALRRVPGARTPVSAVLVDRTGERSTIAFRGEGLGADPGWLPLAALGGARALLCDPRWPEGAARALAAARARGVPGVLDGEKSETRILRLLAPLADHAVFSAPGLQNFAPGAAPAEGLRRALAAGARLAAVTRGERGALWMAAGDPAAREVAAFPVEASDTTGAGDVFHGAYALALAEGRGVPEAMRFAAAAGALRARDGETTRRAAVEALLSGG